MVLVFIPFCSHVEIDQGFILGCKFYLSYFADIHLIGGQDASCRMGSFGIVVGQPFFNTRLGL